MPRQETDLPFGDAFSPGQLSDTPDRCALARVLDLAETHEGDPDAFDAAVADAFDLKPYRAKNVRLGISDAGYQIMGESLAFEFTDFGRSLLPLRDSADTLYDTFAAHILQNLHGHKVLAIIEDLQAEGRSTKFDNIVDELGDRYEFHIDRTSNHWSQMRGWLAKAGVVNTGSAQYDIDWQRIEDLTGATPDALLELSALTDAQRAFLQALARIDPDSPIPNSQIRKVAMQDGTVDIDQNRIVPEILDPLADAGYIEYHKRRGKAHTVEPTDQFEQDVLLPLLEDISAESGIPRATLRLSFSELRDQLDAGTTYDRGVALEVFAIKLGWLLGLEFIDWRVRGQKTGGNEVDVVMDSVGLAFNRWQIQCKNTERKLSIDDVTREVGLARRLRTNTILIIGRSGVTEDARRFANLTMADENIAIAFLLEDDLVTADDDPSHVFETLANEARRAQRLKSL